MARYSDEERASAIALLEAAGYGEQEVGALKSVSKQTGIPTRTLSRWYKSESNPPPAKLVAHKKESLADKYEAAAHLFLGFAVDNHEDMKPREAMTAAAIATDKMQLLRGLPTEIVQLVPETVNAIKKLGGDPAEVFNRFIQRAAEIDHNA